jgi:polyisoprenoid-binding protein YceI
MKILATLLTSLLFAGGVGAAELSRLVAEKSSITFVSKQMGVPVHGSFRKFDAQIRVDPAKPEAGTAKIEVDLASIDAGSNEASGEVKGKQWFNTGAFPKASFVSAGVKPLGGGRYEAHGPLTIKGISRDTVIAFTLRSEANSVSIEGGFALPRLQFRIGEGMWSDTSTVADEVQVKFKLLLSPQK